MHEANLRENSLSQTFEFLRIFMRSSAGDWESRNHTVLAPPARRRRRPQGPHPLDNIHYLIFNI